MSEKSEYIFTWKIKNYSSFYPEISSFINSPYFSVENLNESRWFLEVTPQVSLLTPTDPNIAFVWIFLTWMRTEEMRTEKIPAPFFFSIEIMDLKGRVFKRSGKSPLYPQILSEADIRIVTVDELAKEMDNWEEDILTLRCRIESDKIKKQTIFGSEACTKIDVDKHLFEWDVMTLDHSESISFSLDQYNFEITLTPFFEGLKITFQLKQHSRDLSKPVMFNLTFCDIKGNKIISKRAKHQFEKAEKWEFPDFITKMVMEKCYLDSNKREFKLKCVSYVSKKHISYNKIVKYHFKSMASSGAEVIPKACSVTTMQNDFRSLLLNKKFSDVTIRADDEEFRAHKLVLRVRSPVFEAMFDQNMSENETGIVNITDVDGKTMKTFLEYLYTGIVEKMDCESAKRLILVADKYQVPSLIDVCSSFLKSGLSVENACEIIALADSINCECLKSSAFDFIISNAAEILVSPDWESWIGKNIVLATKILSKLSTDLMSKFK